MSAYVPPIKHVFVINIENKGYDKTWGPTSKAPYLAKTLRSKGVLLNTYYGTAHNSQPNYVAQISGQGPNPEMQADCQYFTNFTKLGTESPGQLRGNGCVFPVGTPNLASQLHGKALRWTGYMDDMHTACRHPAIGAKDDTQQAEKGDQYATRHNPFVYFHSIIDNATYCKNHVLPLSRLTTDLKAVSTTPSFSYVTPDLCDDGHDTPCVDGRPGGLASVNAWMKYWVPKILASPAYQKDGMLVITADESDGPQSDATACCGEGPSTNSPASRDLRAGWRQDRRARAVPVDDRWHLEHHAVQPLQPAGLARGRVAAAVPRLRRFAGPEPLRAGRLQQRLGDRLTSAWLHSRACLRR